MDNDSDLALISRELVGVLKDNLIELPQHHRLLISYDFRRRPTFKLKIDKHRLLIAVYHSAVSHKIDYYDRKTGDPLPSIFSFVDADEMPEEQDSLAPNGGINLKGRAVFFITDSPTFYAESTINRSIGPLIYLFRDSSIALRNIILPIIDKNFGENINMPVCIAMNFGKNLTIYNCVSELDLMLRRLFATSSEVEFSKKSVL